MIPEEYIEYQYLESHGTEYIDTGFRPSNTEVTITIDFQITDPVNNHWLFGYFASTGYSVEAGIYNNALYTGAGFTYTNTSLTARGLATAEHVRTVQTISLNSYLFARNITNDINPIAVRIYSMMIEDGNGDKVMELIPCERVSDGVLGMYDTVSGSFLINQGTGSFGGIPKYHDKWLIEDEGTYYNIVDGELNPLEITEITAQNMMDFGNDEPPDGALLMPLTAPKVHRWNDSVQYLEEPIQPIITAHLTATPFPQTMGVVVDMSHESITGILGVTAQYAGELTVCYSLDDGATYTDEETMAEFLDEDFTVIYEGLPASKQLYLRFVFRDDAVLTNVKFTFTN